MMIEHSISLSNWVGFLFFVFSTDYENSSFRIDVIHRNENPQKNGRRDELVI
jgi:hypothetical protein